MREAIVRCDKCNRVIDTKKIYYSISINRKVPNFSTDTSCGYFDICMECYVPTWDCILNMFTKTAPKEDSK